VLDAQNGGREAEHANRAASVGVADLTLKFSILTSDEHVPLEEHSCEQVPIEAGRNFGLEDRWKNTEQTVLPEAGTIDGWSISTAVTDTDRGAESRLPV
jgi:hypothetical protein